MIQTIAGYDYYPSKVDASLKRKKGETTTYESGLGWYNYNIKEYATNDRKRLFGF